MTSNHPADMATRLTNDTTQRAHAPLAQEAAPTGYRGDRQVLLDLLSRVLATELTGMLRYRQHYFTASGLNAESAATQLGDHASQKLEHVFALAERTVQLGGQPDLNPKHIGARSHVEYVMCDTLKEMMRVNLIAERIVIEHYRRMIDFIGTDDPTTRHLLEAILETTAHHAENMESQLSGIK
ncbi:ferritin-like domain-containing protein [Paludibacterium purpuratum]|uniref:Bacterioferritin n=1 Tax=Paludibacterium purpuratum TaxID=1144873 RepID=A0A4R7BAT6_9NEIS|nr:ferritin-like domain-containing protein [Paludibacterium purpuratum]TDR81971.1 bacterioferritin [Paludibacterium purpuratum]